MATSHEDELRRMALEQAKHQREYMQQKKAATQSQQTWSTAQYSQSEMWMPQKTPNSIVVGPFTQSEYHMIVSKEYGTSTQWETRMGTDMVRRFYPIVEGSPDKKQIPEQLGDFQRGYDEGYEDGKKKG
jgi:hypothetical protein